MGDRYQYVELFKGSSDIWDSTLAETYYSLLSERADGVTSLRAYFGFVHACSLVVEDFLAIKE